MTNKCRAIVQEGPRPLSGQEFPLPETGPEDALLRVEACGICGSDYEQYAGALPAPFPVIPGHEPVGVIEEVGEGAAGRRGGGWVIVSGLARDEAKLALARRFGAHHVINVEAEDAGARVREITDGAMADVVGDVTSYAVEAGTQAVH